MTSTYSPIDDLRGGTLALEHFYEVGEVLSRDTLGTTYLGNQSPQDKPVAVWVLHRLIKVGASPEIIERFKLAAWRASRFNHPNHVALLDFGMLDKELPFIVFEHQPDALLLRQHLAEHGPLSVQHTLDLVEQLADALDRAHAEGLHHNALDTARIRIRIHEDRIHAQILAPGIGLEREELLELEDVVITTDQIRHIPPEIFTREHASTADEDAPLLPPAELPDASRDVYGLAAVAYECLTGSHPYFRDLRDAADGILAMLHEQPLTLTHFELPESMDDVLQAALSDQAQYRYTTIKALAHAFKDAIPLELLEAPRSRRTGRTTGSSRSTRRPRTLREHFSLPAFRFMAAALLVLTLIAGAALTALVSNEPGPILDIKPYYLPIAPVGQGVDVVIEATPEGASPFAPSQLEVEVFRVFPDGETLLIGKAPLIMRNQPPGELHRLVLTASGMRAQQFEFQVKDEGGQLMMIERILNPDLTRSARLNE